MPRVIFTIALLLALRATFSSVPQQAPSRQSPILLLSEMHTGPVTRIDSDVSGTLIITSSYDKTAKIWDAHRGNLIHTLRPPVGTSPSSRIYACAISPDGNLIAVAGWGIRSGMSPGPTIFFYSSHDYRVIDRIETIDQGIADLEFSPDGRLLAVGLLGGSGIRIIDVEKRMIVAERNECTGNCYSVAFGPSGRLAASCSDGTVYVYDSSFTIAEPVRPKQGGVPSSVAFSPDGNLLSVGYEDRREIDLFHVSDLVQYQTIRLSASYRYAGLGISKWSSSGTDLNIVFSLAGFPEFQSVLLRWNESSGIVSENTIHSGTVLDFTVFSDNSVAYASLNNGWGRTSSSGKMLYSSRLSPPEFSTQTHDGLALSSDGNLVCFGVAQAQRYCFSVSGGILNRADRFHLAAPANYDIPASALSASPGFSAVGFASGVRLHARDGSVIWRRDTEAPVLTTAIAANSGLLAGALGDGTIRWYRIDSGAEMLALAISADLREWALWTPDGFWDASVAGAPLIGWAGFGTGEESLLLPVTSAAPHYQRPGIVRNAIRPKGFAFEKSRVNLPDRQLHMAIITPRHGDSTSSAEIDVCVRIDSPVANRAESIELLVNGAPQQVTFRGLIPKSPLERLFTIRAWLKPGHNEIDVTVSNAHARETRSIRVHYAESTFSETPPKLYALIAGISSYRDSSLNLQFAAKDASDFNAALMQQQGRLYRSVTSRVLTDTAASREAILEGFEWIRRETTSRDIAIIFLAGHGLADPYDRVFFMPADGDPDRLRRAAIPLSDVRSYLETTSGKVICFIDACMSGSILRPQTRSRAAIHSIITELASAENGAIIFCSSAPRQSSQEYHAWKNGAFTKALLEGLDGKADYAGGGFITINMLDLYLSERVKELTNGSQTPVSAKPYAIRDFPFMLVPDKF